MNAQRLNEGDYCLDANGTRNAVYVVTPIYPLHYFTVKEKFISPKHWHKEIELVYVMTGMVEINVNSRIFKVNAGEVLVINSGVVHYYIDKTKEGKVQVIKFYKDILMNVNFSKSNNNAISKQYDNTFMCSPDEKVTGLIQEILDSDNDELQECYITGKLLELTIYLLKHPLTPLDRASRVLFEPRRPTSTPATSSATKSPSSISFIHGS